LSKPEETHSVFYSRDHYSGGDSCYASSQK